jgi:RimJ/RimL family protein N-acetyltransferase
MRAAFPERVVTSRLVLTRFVADDLPDLLVMHQDPRVMATLGGALDPEEIARRHQRHLDFWQQHGYGWWAARTRTDGRFVGRGGLRRFVIAGRDEVELAYGLMPEFWGQGLAGELAAASVQAGFEALGVDDIACMTEPTNTRSRRVMEKAGFRYERDVEHAGLPHVLYRLRRADWVK